MQTHSSRNARTARRADRPVRGPLSSFTLSKLPRQVVKRLELLEQLRPLAEKYCAALEAERLAAKQVKAKRGAGAGTDAADVEQVMRDYHKANDRVIATRRALSDRALAALAYKTPRPAPKKKGGRRVH